MCWGGGGLVGVEVPDAAVAVAESEAEAGG